VVAPHPLTLSIQALRRFTHSQKNGKTPPRAHLFLTWLPTLFVVAENAEVKKASKRDITVAAKLTREP